uniref:recombinase family protein n=1 Tax=Algoriphagus sp. TaxID=1872435 RepID=UPI0040486804
MDVVIYTRVSTEDQKENGFSLQDQERRLREHCKKMGFNIKGHYQDNYSGKNFNRPEFQRLLGDIRSKTISVSQLLCVRMDRFSRNLENSLSMIKTLRSFRVELFCLEQNIDLDSPESIIPYVLNMLLPQVENERRGLNTKQGLRQAKREGRWVARAPKGYMNDKNSKTVVIGKDAHFVKRAFQEVALQIVSVDQIRLELIKEGFKCSKQQFYNLLKNPFYTGYIKIEAWKNEKEEIVKGLHDPLVNEQLFSKVQEVFRKGRMKDVRPSKYNDKFPLRGHLVCNQCGSKLTASSSKGRSKHYSYYHCQHGCNERHDAIGANQEFSDYLKSFSIGDEVVELYNEILADVFKEREGTKEENLKSFIGQIKVLAEQQDSLDNRFLKGDLSSEDYNRINKKIKENISSIESKVKELEQQESNLERHLKVGLSIMRNVSYYYEMCDIPIKQKIVGSIFPEKLIFDGKNYRTVRMNSFIELISSKSKGLDGYKRKQVTKLSDLSNMAPPPGLEPGTP